LLANLNKPPLSTDFHNAHLNTGSPSNLIGGRQPYIRDREQKWALLVKTPKKQLMVSHNGRYKTNSFVKAKYFE